MFRSAAWALGARSVRARSLVPSATWASRPVSNSGVQVQAVRRLSSPGAPSTNASPSGGEEVRTAQHAWEKSCYFNIDYKVDEDETVYDAVQRMAAYNVGCLIVTTNGQVSGIITERDYVCKIALHGKQSKTTKVKEICTGRAKMVAAKRSDTIETCVRKMIKADIRHLPVIDDDNGEVFGLISVKDLVKEYTKERDVLLCKMLGIPTTK